MPGPPLKFNMVHQAPDLPSKPPHQQSPHLEDGKPVLPQAKTQVILGCLTPNI